MVPSAKLPGLLRRLQTENLVPDPVIQEIAEDVRKNPRPIHQVVTEKSGLDHRVLTAVMASEFGMMAIDPRAVDFSSGVIGLCRDKYNIEEDWIRRQRVLPLAIKPPKIYVATSDPTAQRSLGELRFKTGLTPTPMLAESSALQSAIEAALRAEGSTMDLDVEDVDLDVEVEEEGAEEAAAPTSLEEVKEGPIVQFVKKMLIDAIKQGASDVHFEPYEDMFRVRFRQDGVLRTVSTAPHGLHARISSRLKVMAQLDIAERRLPQDGRIKMTLGNKRQMDFRVSTLPTLFGEKVVLRLLDGSAARMGIEKLGYEDDQRALFESALSNPYGMILVTGPTGSGKTVSLYTGLNILNNDERNISTAEDPVEIRVKGINQVQVNPKKGLNFATALRSFLRQDPDVIMVGEIRDLETAEIAVKAAQTGHMVLSTLHTNDAPQTISRLMNMGIATYNITSSVTLVIAQRLARRLHSCKQKVNYPPEVLRQAGFTEDQIKEGMTLYEAKKGGCDECNEGYRGRVGIYQVMPMTETIQAIILAGGNALEIAKAAQKDGVRDLRESALMKVREGVISLTEADRVTKT